LFLNIFVESLEIKFIDQLTKMTSRHFGQ